MMVRMIMLLMMTMILLMPRQEDAIYAGLGPTPATAAYDKAERSLRVRRADTERKFGIWWFLITCQPIQHMRSLILYFMYPLLRRARIGPSGPQAPEGLAVDVTPGSRRAHNSWFLLRPGYALGRVMH
jgi:hypothetical protein